MSATKETNTDEKAMKAFTDICKLLEPLPDEARKRVLGAVAVLFKLSIVTVSRQPDGTRTA